MTRRVENQDGIYPITRITTSAELTEQERGLINSAFSQVWNLDARLANILESAQEIAETGTTAEIRRDAQKVVYMASHELPTYRTRGLHDEALVVALDIGRTAEQIHVRPFEPDVRIGKASTAGGRTGTENLTRKTQDRYVKINAWIANKMKTKSKVSLTQRRHQAAAQFDVSYDTVLEAQKTIRKK